MRTRVGLLALLLATAAIAQTTPAPRPSANASRTGPSREAGRTGSALPDPDLFDGSKFEAEKRPETGMIGEFEMPGSADDNSKVGGNPGEAGGNQAPPKPGAAGAAGAAGTAGAAGAAGGGATPPTPGSEQAGGGAGVENSGAAGAVGGALDQSKPMGSSGSSGAGDPNAKAEGVQADRLEGGGSAGSGGAAAAQNAAGQGNKQKPPVSKIGSAELRIDALPESDKDVIGREAAPGGTQGSNRAMPAGKGGQGANNQNKGVEKGKVIPKGL